MEETISQNNPFPHFNFHVNSVWVKRGLIFVISLLSILLAIYYIYHQSVHTRAASITSLYPIPQTMNVAVGDTITIPVVVNTKDESLTGAMLRLNFDPKEIQPISIVSGEFLPVVLSGGKVTTSSVTITLGCEPTSPKKGTGILAQITAKVIGPIGPNSMTQMTFDSTTVLTAIGDTNNVSDEKIPLTITIQIPKPTIP